MFRSTQNLPKFTPFILLAIGLSLTDQVRAQSTFGQVDFPYQALVLRDGAEVHSGPGKLLYGTEKLNQGAAVEVYRHDPGGWCAIRPTPDSFGLIPKSTLKLVSDGVGKIVADGTRAWVGTKLGPVEKPLWQVKLKKDELVEVIGQVSWPHPEGHSTIWYQIAPPAGEFRWIKMADIQLPAAIRSSIQQAADVSIATNNNLVRSLSDVNPALQKPLVATEGNLAVQQASLQTEFSTPSMNKPSVQSQSQPSANLGWRQATRAIQKHGTTNLGSSASYDRTQRKSSKNDTFIDSNSIKSSFGKSPDLADSEYASNSQSARVPANRMADADVSTRSLARGLGAARNEAMLGQSGQLQFSPSGTTSQIGALELQLTNEMLKSNPGQWKLEDLELQATNIFRKSNDAYQRSWADKFLVKIENCRMIRSGYQNESSGKNRKPTFGRGGTEPIGTGVSADIELSTKYDAHGWLNQMIRDGGERQSEYVLQDATGKVTHHVAPIQGMNLHRYLKSHVGIVGQRGYHSRLKLDHVTAYQIVELDERR